jgi:hypothetical protein
MVVTIIDIITDNQNHLRPQHFALLGDIKSHIECCLAEKTGMALPLNLMVYPLSSALVTYIEESQRASCEKALDELKANDLIDYELTWYGPISKHVIAITKVNPALSLAQQRDLRAKTEEQLTAEVTKEAIVVAPPAPAPSAHRAHSIYPVQASQNLQLSVADLANTDNVKTAILNAGTQLSRLRIGDLPIATFAMRNFDTYNWIADLLLMECICNGDLVLLESLMSVKHSGQVRQIETQHQASTIRIDEQSHSYSLKINFNLANFGEYLRAKKARSDSYQFLATQEDVKKCLQYVCGEESPRVDSIIAVLEKNKAFLSFEDVLGL